MKSFPLSKIEVSKSLLMAVTIGTQWVHELSSKNKNQINEFL